MVGAFLLILAGSGLTLCRVSADYSRYLPRTSSSIGTVIWPIVGSIIPATVLIAFGAALANSDPGLGHAVAGDPIGALTAILPIWYLVPFVTVVIVTTIMACAIDIYSGSLALLAVGAPLKRFQATLVAGTACLLAALYILCFGQEFFGQFQGILITLGMPVAAWAGIMCTDIGLRRAGYSDQDLRSTTGRYGDVRWSSLWVLILACAIGWGLVTNTTAGWLGWQGYLLGPIGGRTGARSHSNLGILVAILIT